MGISRLARDGPPAHALCCGALRTYSALIRGRIKVVLAASGLVFLVRVERVRRGGGRERLLGDSSKIYGANPLDLASW